MATVEADRVARTAWSEAHMEAALCTGNLEWKPLRTGLDVDSYSKRSRRSSLEILLEIKFSFWLVREVESINRFTSRDVASKPVKREVCHTVILLWSKWELSDLYYLPSVLFSRWRWTTNSMGSICTYVVGHCVYNVHLLCAHYIPMGLIRLFNSFYYPKSSWIGKIKLLSV